MFMINNDNYVYFYQNITMLNQEVFNKYIANELRKLQSYKAEFDHLHTVEDITDLHDYIATDAIQNLYKQIYPIGYVYTTTETKLPESLEKHGVWKRVNKGDYYEYTLVREATKELTVKIMLIKGNYDTTEYIETNIKINTEHIHDTSDRIYLTEEQAKDIFATNSSIVCLENVSWEIDDKNIIFRATTQDLTQDETTFGYYTYSNTGTVITYNKQTETLDQNKFTPILNYYKKDNDELKSVTSLANLFIYNKLSGYTEIDLSGWDVSKVTNMSSMFSSCSNLRDLTPLQNWDVSKVTNMSSMFGDCTSLDDLTPLSNWTFGDNTNMSYMFSGCASLKTVNLSNWTFGDNTNMSNMFYNCTSLQTINLQNWDVSKVTNMSYMFSYCSSSQTINLQNWDVSKVTDMSNMFDGCSLLQTIDLQNWTFGDNTNMSYMFQSCSSLQTITLSTWDVSKVTNMGNMFRNCSSLQIIIFGSKFVIKEGTNLTNMFSNCDPVQLQHLNSLTEDTFNNIKTNGGLPVRSGYEWQWIEIDSDTGLGNATQVQSST